MATANPGPEPQNNDSSDNNSPGSGKDEEKGDAEADRAFEVTIALNCK